MSTTLQNLTASQMRIAVKNDGGHIATHCTLGSFVRDNRCDIVPVYGRDAVAKIARNINAFGSMKLTLGRRSVFTISAISTCILASMKTTKTDLIARVARMEREHEPLTLALYDLAHGDVKWFARCKFELGISRPSGAHGGIVIVKHEGSVSAHYWEQWSHDTHAHLSAIVTGENTEYNRELLRRRDLIESVNQFVRSCQRAA